jgi:hypothetical protein
VLLSTSSLLGGSLDSLLSGSSSRGLSHFVLWGVVRSYSKFKETLICEIRCAFQNAAGRDERAGRANSNWECPSLAAVCLLYANCMKTV